MNFLSVVSYRVIIVYETIVHHTQRQIIAVAIICPDVCRQLQNGNIIPGIIQTAYTTICIAETALLYLLQALGPSLKFRAISAIRRSRMNAVQFILCGFSVIENVMRS